jgi:maltose alpha-D-glucosyltransferase/alpha-amylase/(1->4)-alpha-D-glucan 1-alpha-D-glucosylmutase
VLSQIGAFALEIAPAGVVNSLAQTLIQLTAPGVPDRYQGTEGWDFSLVDPDNRRPIDYALQHALLNCRAGWDAWMRGWRDGRIKAQLIRTVLGVRLAHGDLFRLGDYRQVQALGPLADNVLAFERHHDGARLLAVTTRHAARHLNGDVPRIPAGNWRDTALFVSGGATGSRWIDLLTGQTVAAGSDGLPLAAVLAMLPVALLMPAD